MTSACLRYVSEKIEKIFGSINREQATTDFDPKFVIHRNLISYLLEEKRKKTRSLCSDRMSLFIAFEVSHLFLSASAPSGTFHEHGVLSTRRKGQKLTI